MHRYNFSPTLTPTRTLTTPLTNTHTNTGTLTVEMEDKYRERCFDLGIDPDVRTMCVYVTLHLFIQYLISPLTIDVTVRICFQIIWYILQHNKKINECKNS